MTDLRVLDARLAAMGRHPNVLPSDLARFRAALLAEDDWGLFHINPLQVAPKLGLSEGAAVDLFVLGASEGLFELVYLELCPNCGGVSHEVVGLGRVAQTHYDCQLCRLEVDAALDDNIAVVFTLSSSIRRLDIQPLGDAQSYRRFHFFSGYEPGPKLGPLLASLPMGFAAVPAQGEALLEIDTRGYPELFIGSFNVERSLSLPVRAGAPLQAQVVLEPAQALASVEAVGEGRVTLRLRNTTDSAMGTLTFARDVEKVWAAVQESRPRYLPFLTARALLSLQRFRELYRVQDLPADLKLRIKSLTLLFTDLSGSTALYDTTGDVTAFDIVREHFAALTDCVRRNDGAVVKTMGDAIMASFTHPASAVAAASEMIDAMRPVTERASRYGHALGLKVGIHEGSALVVNADDRLDYFGQAVNVAARVQGLAGPGEIWVTQCVFHAAGERLQQAGFGADPRRVPLKGVEGLVDVVACARG